MYELGDGSRFSSEDACFFDELTALPNRRALLTYLEQYIEQCGDCEDQLFAMLILGVDNFGIINSSLGIQIGDQLLVQIGQRLQDAIRLNDCLFRAGGDEYVIVIHDIKSVSSLDKIAARICESLFSAFYLEDNEIFISINLGITHNNVSIGKAEDFFRDASAAMNHAKSSGSSHCVVFQPKIQEKFEHHLDLANSLRKALERNELFLEYQPIFSLNEELLVGFEALVRWKHSRWGIISPKDFIPLAEKSQLIDTLGQWVLQEACQQMKNWQEQFSEAHNLFVSVNVSVCQILCGDFHKKVDESLKAADLKSEFLSLEITESVLLEHSQQTLCELAKVKSLGVKIAIDDFGTGYSSLSYLLDFPCDILKLDASFTDDVDNNHRKFYLVQSLLALGQGLGVEVTAEGLETQEQLVHFRALGCNYGQGYIFSKPLNNQNVNSFILSHIATGKILTDTKKRHLISSLSALSKGHFSRGDLLTKNQYLEMKVKNLQQEAEDLKNLLSTAESHAEVIESQLYEEVSEHQKTFLKLQESNLELKRLSYIDTLTQIPNRRYFDEHCCQAWEKAIFLQDLISLVIVDVDYFKLYNDEYGHRTGDFCLLQIAQTLSNALIYSTDFVARYGGEEFALICSGGSQEDATGMAQKICTAVTSLKLQHCRSPISPYVTVSAGVANVIPQKSNSFHDFFQQADEALYCAKQKGRNGFSVATSLEAIV
ncbi:MAG: diguanylate cyclase [Leptolyngbya sp. SIOISBB]|nr:diguanylate cyclase [Leptolyngbya sp. SIOISBB]